MLYGLQQEGEKAEKEIHFFKSSTNQAPAKAQSGSLGEEYEFKIVLKSVADIGLVGFPNVGKSTLISTISSAKPKVASYPFTTLRPNLGVVKLDEERKFVIADIPGIIPDAHQGKGLGLQFLRHIERTFAIAQLIDVSIGLEDKEEVSDEELKIHAMKQFDEIENELKQFSEEIVERPRLVVFSKADLKLNSQELNKRAYNLTLDIFKKKGLESVLISCVSNIGMKELQDSLFDIASKKH